jgi:hypothetical protein
MAGPTDSFLSLSYSILFNRLLTLAGHNEQSAERLTKTPGAVVGALCPMLYAFSFA